MDLAICAVCIDSGGHHTHEGLPVHPPAPLAKRASSEGGRAAAAQCWPSGRLRSTSPGRTTPRRVELNYGWSAPTRRGTGSTTATTSRWPRALHFSATCRLTSSTSVAERKVVRYVRVQAHRLGQGQVGAKRGPRPHRATWRGPLPRPASLSRSTVEQPARNAGRSRQPVRRPVSTVPSAADEADEHEPAGGEAPSPSAAGTSRAEREPTIPTNWPGVPRAAVSEPPIDEVSMSTAQQRWTRSGGVQDILKKRASRCARENRQVDRAANWRDLRFWSSSTPKPQPWKRLRTTDARARFASAAEARDLICYRYRITSKRIRNSYEGAGTGRRAAGGTRRGGADMVAIPACRPRATLASGGEERPSPRARSASASAT